jgi:hypothetical protein
MWKVWGFIAIFLCIAHQTDGKNLVLQTLTSGSSVMLALKTPSSHDYTAQLELKGGYSICNLPDDDAAFMDVHKMIFYPVFDADASARAAMCTVDMYFAFQSVYRSLRLSFDRLIFSATTSSLVEEDDWIACSKTPKSDALCIIDVDGIDVEFFSPTKVFYENVHSIEIDGVTLTPPEEWSLTPEKTISAPIYQILAHREIHYDVVTNRIAFTGRVPTITMKIVNIIIFGILGLAFSARILITTDWKPEWLHIIVLIVAFAGVVVAAATGTRSLSNTLARYLFVGTAFLYFLLTFGIKRYYTQHWRCDFDEIIVAACNEIEGAAENRKDQARLDETKPFLKKLFDKNPKLLGNQVDAGFQDDLETLLSQHASESNASKIVLEVQPDLGLIMMGLILTIYAVSSHTMIIIPTILVFILSSKGVADIILVNSKNELSVISVITDLVVIGAMWRWIVSEFLESTTEGHWLLQIAFIVLLVVIAGVFLAAMRHNILFANESESENEEAAASDHEYESEELNTDDELSSDSECDDDGKTFGDAVACAGQKIKEQEQAKKVFS